VGLLYWVHRKLGDHPGSPLGNTEVHDMVTVLIAFRNEAEHIDECLSALNRSEAITSSINVLLVDDHSTDESIAVIQKSSVNCDRLKIEVIQSTGYGKKAALREGIERIQQGWIYLTDADCQVGPKTIGGMINQAEVDNVQVAFGPVLYHDRSLWERLLAYENLNTQAISEAFVRSGRPVMVNGGNLLMHADLKERYMDSLQMKRASGDDVFFAQQLNQDQLSGSYALETAVLTSPPADIRALVQQRVRWASKYPGYKRSMSRFLPAYVFVSNVVFLGMGMAWLTSSTLLNVLLLLFFVKWLIEFTFHRVWFAKYSFQAKLLDSLALSILFPIYFTAVGLMALGLPRFDWKGRSYDR